MNDNDLKRVGKAEKALFDKLCKKTNGDKIRSMTDDELARFLELERDCERCAISCQSHCGKAVSRASCMLKIKEWLKQEAKE